MAKKGGGGSGMSKLVSFLMWLTGVIVALSVGFAMTDGGLSLPNYLGGTTVASVAGWIVIITTGLGVILEVFHSLS